MFAAPNWNYRVIELTEKFKGVPWDDVASVAGTLNVLGNQGWELVNAVPTTVDGNTRTVVLFLKQPK